MDALQGIFDQGFSGILEDSNRKTMPDYIERLAEQEIDYEPPKLEVPNIPFDKDSGLSRANELTSDGSRESSKDNRFTIEKTQKTAQDEKVKTINSLVETMILNGKEFDQIRASLLEKYPKEQVNRYLETKIKLFLDKFAFLGFENLEEKHANIVEQSKNEFPIKRSTVHDILDKFSKLEYVSNSTVKEYKDLLSSKRPLYVASKFMFSLDTIKQSHYNGKEARVAFQRDDDEKLLTLRDVNNNLKKNSLSAKQSTFISMLNDYKQGIYSKLSKSEISKKIARTYGYDKFQKFSEKYKSELTSIDRFHSRQTFDTNFASSALQGVEVNTKNKEVSIDIKTMLNYAFDQMTNGNEIEFIKNSMKKKFGLEVTTQFLNANEHRLTRHYGQLGYLFIDSNIYSSCNDMAASFSQLQHAGSKLIYSLKANPKCANCSIHKEGTCGKVGLLVSNSPIVRSSRAARRVFEKAATFVPKTYIEAFSSQLKEDDSNLDLVSKFARGIQAALDEEKKNIGKRASKDRTETTDAQESFVGPADNFDVDLFQQQSNSAIIDSVLNESKTSSKVSDEAYQENLKKAIDNLSSEKKSLRKRYLALPDDALTIRAAKQLGKEHKVRYQDILKDLKPSKSISGVKYWDAQGNIVGQGI